MLGSSHKNKLPPNNYQLLEEINQTQLQMDQALNNLNNVVEPDLIDSWIYQFNASSLRFSFLLAQLKSAPLSTPAEDS